MSDEPDDELAPWSFVVPESQIARFPSSVRDASRLWAVGDGPHPFSAIQRYIRPDDLIVINDVRVFNARLRAHRATGGAVEVMISAPDGEDFRAFLSPSRRLAVGESLPCGPGSVHLRERYPDGTWRVSPQPDIDTLADAVGEVPLPPYLRRRPVHEDRERYQTVYARPGALRAAAAPTAGLHLTPELLERWGSQVVRVRLEVGAGTFAPLSAEALRTNRLHTERFEVPQATFEAVERARSEGRRVVAIGTTSARVLEAMQAPGTGTTDLFIRAGYSFRRVDALLTNFHLPRSSLLMLVTTFGGHDAVMDAYAQAVKAGMRFFSFGDAMWVTRAA